MFCSLLTRSTIPCACHRKLNVHKCSVPVSFSLRSPRNLRNLLCATAACTLWTPQLPKGLRSWGALHILNSKCPSRYNVVQLFISIWPDGSAPAAAASLLFDLPEPPTIGKTQCFATFSPFRAPGFSFFCLSLLWSSFFFFLLLFFSLTLPISAFYLSIWSEVFLIIHHNLGKNHPTLCKVTYSLQAHEKRRNFKRVVFPCFQRIPGI